MKKIGLFFMEKDIMNHSKGNYDNRILELTPSQTAFLSCLPGGFFIYRADNEELLFVNDHILHLYGCKTEEEFRTFTKNSFRNMVHPDDLDRVEEEILQQVQGISGAFDYVEYRIIRRDGSIRWVDDYGRLIETEPGIKVFFVFIADSTEKKNLQKTLSLQDERRRILSEMAGDIVFDIACSTCSIEIYGDFEKRFGRPPCIMDFLPFLCRERCPDKIPSFHIHTGKKDFPHVEKQVENVSFTSENGTVIWSQCQLAKFPGENGRCSRIVGRFLDTHELTIREITYRQKAERDALTGIYNRQAAKQLIYSWLRKASDSEWCLLAIFDIDNFKSLNDTYGHPAGDQVLKEFSSLLVKTFRKTDVCSRIGGDEFLIFLPHLNNPHPCLKKLETLVSFYPRFDPGQSKALPQITLSVGVILVQGPCHTFEELYSHADEALYQAKRSGKNSYVVYQDTSCK